MAILAPGTFRVSDYRKPIPERVKRAAVAWKARAIALDGGDIEGRLSAFGFAVEASRVQYDHRPALENRPYDTEADDFIPPQHDPQRIDVIPPEEHKARTSGATGQPYRGDVPMRARSRSLANKTEVERQRAAEKAGQPYERRADIPPPTKGSRRPKAKIQSPGFRKGGPKQKIPQRPKKPKIHKPPVRRFS
jgi:hypothetical protein